MSNRAKDGDHSMEAGPSKLTPEQQLEFAQRIAWFWKPMEVKKYFLQKYKKRLQPEIFYQYKNAEKWKPIIQKFRDEYLKKLSDVPLANKRKRLDDLQRLYERAIDEKDYAEAKSLIREFREEMERKVGEVSFNFTQITHNEFHDMSDEDLANEKAKTLEQLEKVRKMKMLTQRGSNGLEIKEAEVIEEA